MSNDAADDVAWNNVSKGVRAIIVREVVAALKRVRNELASMNPMTAANNAVRIVNTEIDRIEKDDR